MIWSWKSGSRVKGDATEVGDQLYALYEKHGELTPELVREEGRRRKQSPLGKCFDWDVEAAANAHWRTYAGYILRSIEYVTDDEEEAEAMRAWFPITVVCSGSEEEGDEEVEIVFHSTPRIMEDPDMREDLFARVRGELRAFRRKHRKLNEFAAVWAAIDGI